MEPPIRSGPSAVGSPHVNELRSPKTPDRHISPFGNDRGPRDDALPRDNRERSGSRARDRNGSKDNRPRKPSNHGSNSSDDSPRSPLYKTELCRSFEETNQCRYGSKCQFAHGSHEIRPIVRHPRYKTEYCKTFSMHGTCPYGKRCRFVHESLATTPTGMTPHSLHTPTGILSPTSSAGGILSPRNAASSPDIISPRGSGFLSPGSHGGITSPTGLISPTNQHSSSPNFICSPLSVGEDGPEVTKFDLLEMRNEIEAPGTPGTPSRSRLAIFRKLTVDEEPEEQQAS